MSCINRYRTLVEGVFLSTTSLLGFIKTQRVEMCGTNHLAISIVVYIDCAHIVEGMLENPLERDNKRNYSSSSYSKLL